jgi:hypothetical protein
MTDLLLLFLICLIGAECWQRRQQSELAERLIRHYCKNTNLQLLSVARQSFGLPLLLSQVIHKANAFVFEYSADNVGKDEGELYLIGLHQPIFRVNPPEAPKEQDTTSTGIVINMPLNNEQSESQPAIHSNNVIPFRQRPH